MLGDRDAAVGEARLGRREVGIFVGPVRAVALGVVEEVGQAFEQLRVPGAVTRPVPRELGDRPCDPGRVAGRERGEVAGPGEVDELVASPHRVVGFDERVHAHEAVLVDVVVRHHVGRHVVVGPVEVVERDLGREVVLERGGRWRPRPVGEREHRVGLG